MKDGYDFGENFRFKRLLQNHWILGKRDALWKCMHRIMYANLICVHKSRVCVNNKSLPVVNMMVCIWPKPRVIVTWQNVSVLTGQNGRSKKKLSYWSRKCITSEVTCHKSDIRQMEALIWAHSSNHALWYHSRVWQGTRCCVGLAAFERLKS